MSLSASLLANLGEVPPSQFLPRLGRDLSKHDPAVLKENVNTLARIFLPPVLGSGKEKPSPGGLDVPESDSGYNSSVETEAPSAEDEAEEVYALLRGDEYEHNAARDWLVNLVKRGSDWTDLYDEDSEERDVREAVIDKAASTLAVWSGTSAAGALLRTINLPHEIALTVNDAAYSNALPDSVGVQTWGSSILFARRIAQMPSSWGIITTDAGCSTNPIRSQRILELGAGTGVLSLAMASLPNLPSSTLIVATDYNTIVLENLRKNVGLNFGSSLEGVEAGPSRRGVDVHSLDWLAFHETGDGVDVRTVGRDGIRHKEDLALNGTTKQDIIAQPPFDERFDLIFGADIVYEAHQAPWIHSTVSHFLAYPEADSTVEPSFHLFVPLRPTHQAEIVSLEATFPLASGLAPRAAGGDWRLATLEVESLVRTEGVGRADETCYRRYRIGWA